MNLSQTASVLDTFGYRQAANNARWLGATTSRKIEVQLLPAWVGAYMIPGKAKTIFFNLLTLFSPKKFIGHVEAHEDFHLKHDENWGMKFPVLQNLHDEHVNLLQESSGVDMLGDLTAMIEGFTEAATARKEGKDQRVTYNEYEVPMVERLDWLSRIKTGQSLIDAFIQFDQALFIRTVRKLLLVLMSEKWLPEVSPEIISEFLIWLETVYSKDKLPESKKEFRELFQAYLDTRIS